MCNSAQPLGVSSLVFWGAVSQWDGAQRQTCRVTAGMPYYTAELLHQYRWSAARNMSNGTPASLPGGVFEQMVWMKTHPFSSKTLLSLTWLASPTVVLCFMNPPISRWYYRPLYNNEMEAIKVLLPSKLLLCQPEAIKSHSQAALFS